jgi:hypothetical protein
LALKQKRVDYTDPFLLDGRHVRKDLPTRCRSGSIEHQIRQELSLRRYESGLLVQARGSNWARLIFQDLVKSINAIARDATANA